MTKPVALITGGARGIGGAITRALARDHRVAFTWHAGAVAATQMKTELPEALSLHQDLATPDAPEHVVAEVVAAFGRLDVLVNNAATVAETLIDATEPQVHLAQYHLNAVVPSALVSASLPHMPSGGSIINIASINADFPPVSAGVYAASKAALVALTKSQAKALGPRGIRVNAVSPGAVERDYAPRPQELQDLFIAETALGRIGQPDDIAPVVQFLASPAARWITGEVIRVSGGFRL